VRFINLILTAFVFCALLSAPTAHAGKTLNQLFCESLLTRAYYTVKGDSADLARTRLFQKYRTLLSQIFRGVPARYLSAEVEFASMDPAHTGTLAVTDGQMGIILFDISLKHHIALPLIHAHELQHSIDVQQGLSQVFQQITLYNTRPSGVSLRDWETFIKIAVFESRAFMREFRVLNKIYDSGERDLLRNNVLGYCTESMLLYEQAQGNMKTYVLARLDAYFFDRNSSLYKEYSHVLSAVGGSKFFERIVPDFKQ